MENTNHIHIQTTQNVKLQYEIASIVDRIFAFLIDAAIVLGTIGIIAYIYYETVFMSYNESVNIIVGIVLMLPFLLYNLLSEIFNNGQSIGKRIMKIKVMRLDGTEPTLGNYFIRWMSRVIDVAGVGYGIGLIVIMLNEKGQRLGDIAAGTTVAKIKQRVSLDDTILAFASDNYKPIYPAAKKLSSKDIETIKEAIYFHLNYQNERMVFACAYKTKTLMDIDPNTDQSLSYEFLTDVINDSAYYKSQEQH